MVGADVEIAKIDQRVGDGVLIALRPLDTEDLAIALFGSVEIVHECAGVAQIAEGIRQFGLIVGGSVVGDGGFPGSASLDQITTMEKNPRPMFVILAHELSAISSQLSASGHLELSTKNSALHDLVAAFRRIFSILDLNVVLFFQA